MSEEKDKKTEAKGVWRTICGRKVFIADGQTLTQAMKASGKFSEKEVKHASEFDGEDNITDAVAEILGEEYTGVKGQDAIKKILKEKKGHVKDAFTRPDIGGITLIWGDDSVGLQHLMNNRKRDGINIDEFLSNLTEVIETGEVVKINNKGRFEILKNGKMAIIAPALRDGKITYLFTAFKTRQKE